jgi:NAD(P)-dependent dehydrogenase (short-subunit alcohol dehydrogenase family)
MARIQELFDLTGRVAVVTGGGTGLGLQMATALAESGAHVVLCARNLARCEAAAKDIAGTGPGEVLAIRCDVTSQDDTLAMAEQVMKHFGRVDVLVNNAGGSEPEATPETLSLESFKQTLDINVAGSFLCAQALGRHMIAQKSGRIINIASLSGLKGKNPKVKNTMAYGVAKGAVISFTRDLAVKWAQHNIRVNAIAPGIFRTKRNAARFDARRELLVAENPLHIAGGDDDMKGLVVYLASDASRFMTGAIIPLDGGATAW